MRVISQAAAERLQRAGVRWHPCSGDRFVVRSDELAGEVFTLADMTIEAREYPTGTLLAFNGTTEWALDSVQIDQVLWLPSEEQLRELLGTSFLGLRRSDAGEFEVLAHHPAREPRTFVAASAPDAYAAAVLDLVEWVQETT